MRLQRLLVFSLPLIVVVMSVAPAQGKSNQHRKQLASKASRRTKMAHESVSARLTGAHGATELTEQGTAQGTINCPLTVNIKLSYTQSQITFYCGTLLVGSGTTAFYVSGQTAYFRGTLVVTRGSGNYRHSAGSRLSITGTLHRGTYALSAQVTGPLYI
jgi:hypothetical protein